PLPGPESPFTSVGGACSGDWVGAPAPPPVAPATPEPICPIAATSEFSTVTSCCSTLAMSPVGPPPSAAAPAAAFVGAAGAAAPPPLAPATSPPPFCAGAPLAPATSVFCSGLPLAPATPVGGAGTCCTGDPPPVAP